MEKVHGSSSRRAGPTQVRGRLHDIIQMRQLRKSDDKVNVKDNVASSFPSSHSKITLDR